MPLPDFENSERTIDALRRVVRDLQDVGITERDQLAALNAHISKYPDAYGGKPISFSPDAMNAFTNGRSVPRRREVFLRAFWETLIAEGRASLLERAWNHAGGGVDPSTLTGIVHAFLSPGAAFNREAITRLRGRYVLHRPFFRDPSQIMVCELTCGMEAAETDFAVRIAYPRALGPPIEETALGAIIPYERSCLFLGKINETSAPFVFILTNLLGPAEGYEEGDGALLVGASGTTPSAYPLHIQRVHHGDELPAVGVITRDAFATSSPLARHVLPVLDRGFTSWR